jgi:hypothetical protein
MRRVACAKDRNGLVDDPEDVATELGIGLYEVTSITTATLPTTTRPTPEKIFSEDLPFRETSCPESRQGKGRGCLDRADADPIEPQQG